jgi:hypothetical protein
VGIGFLVEAALRIIIAYTVGSFQTAYAISNILPFVFLAALITATVVLGRQTRRTAATRIDVNGPSAEPTSATP